MSLLPLLVNLAEELTNFDGYEPDGDFGFGIYPNELSLYHRIPSRLSLAALPARHRNYPYSLVKKSSGLDDNKVAKKPKSEGTMTIGKNGFQVCMDVQHFKPNELTVKTVDNTVVIEGKHEELDDGHGYISRHFIRKYKLPAEYDPNEVVSQLSSDGVLTVKASPPKTGESSSERVVQIQHTGPAHLSIKENPTAAGKAKTDSGPGDGNVENGQKSNEKMED